MTTSEVILNCITDTPSLTGSNLVLLIDNFHKALNREFSSYKDILEHFSKGDIKVKWKSYKELMTLYPLAKQRPDMLIRLIVNDEKRGDVLIDDHEYQVTYVHNGQQDKVCAEFLEEHGSVPVDTPLSYKKKSNEKVWSKPERIARPSKETLNEAFNEIIEAFEGKAKKGYDPNIGLIIRLDSTQNQLALWSETCRKKLAQMCNKHFHGNKHFSRILITYFINDRECGVLYDSLCTP